jgi:hypothetical protein
VESYLQLTSEERGAELIADALSVMPEVEVGIADASLEVDEMEAVRVQEEQTRYDYDLETMTVTPRTVMVSTVVQQATGRRVRELRENVRFDNRTGKFFRRLTEDDFHFLVDGSAPAFQVTPEVQQLVETTRLAPTAESTLPLWVRSRAPGGEFSEINKNGSGSKND